MKLVACTLVVLLAASGSARGAGDSVTLHVRDVAPEAWSVEGADDGRFEWRPGGGVRVTSDSRDASSRLLAPLPFTLDGSTSFRVEVDFVLEDLDASPVDFFQVSMALVNRATTGLNRTGTALPAPPWFIDDADVFDAVEFAYFPNVTFFGGPFLQPTVFGAQAGSSAFWNFAANFGSSSDLGDNTGDQASELPLGAPLRVVMNYEACVQSLTTRVFELGRRGPVEIRTGIEPLDLASVNSTGTFRVDALAINAYHDGGDSDPSTPSLLSRITVERAVVERLAPPEARLVPPAINERAGGPAHVLVRGGDPGGGVRLVEVDGFPVDETLAAHAAGDRALRVDVDRIVAAAPFVIEVGGCRLSLEPLRLAPR